MNQTVLEQSKSSIGNPGIAGTVSLLIFLVSALLPPVVSCGQSASAAPSTMSASKSPTEIEYDVKAAFIYNFMKFVEWPAEKKIDQDKQPGKSAPMIIGILGKNPFGKAFEPILDKTIQGRPIQIVEIPSYQEFFKKSADRKNAKAIYSQKYQQTIRQCNILFVCASEKEHLPDIIDMSGDHAVLTVSDLDNFAQKGGMIGFVKEKNKIRFEINLKTANQKKIKIRSQLLSLARKIYKK